MTTIFGSRASYEINIVQSSSAEKAGGKKSGSNFFRSAIKGVLNLFCCRTPSKVRKAQSDHASRPFSTSFVESRGNARNELQISTLVKAKSTNRAIGGKENTTATGVKISSQKEEGETWMRIKATVTVARNPADAMATKVSANCNSGTTVAKKSTSEQEKNRKEALMNTMKYELQELKSKQKETGGYEVHIKRHQRMIEMASKENS